MSISAAERRSIPLRDFAGDHRSFPIRTQADLDNAAHLIGHAPDPEKVKQRIIAIAKRKGLTLPAAWTSDNAKSANIPLATPEFKALDLDTLIFYGSEVKSLGEGKYGGYLVRFSSADDPDVSSDRDFFTPETDFDIDWSEENAAKTSVYYHHGLDETLGVKKIGKGTLTKDDVGVWLEAQLAARDEYETAILKMAEAGALGWSSGTAPNLVRRKKVAGKNAHEITHWPLGIDASLTPTPAEPRNAALSLKSLLTLETTVASEETPVTEGRHERAGAAELSRVLLPGVVTEPEPEVKASLLDCSYSDLDQQASLAAIGAYSDALMSLLYQSLSDLSADDELDDASDHNADVEELLCVLSPAFDEYRDACLSALRGILSDANASLEEAMKTLRDLFSAEGQSRSELTLSQKAERLETDAAALLCAVSRRQEYRIKAGRTLSAATRQKLTDIHARLSDTADQLKGLFADDAPNASDAPTDPAQTPDAGKAARLALLNAKVRELQLFSSLSA